MACSSKRTSVLHALRLHSRVARRAGMTMIEIMVVLAIMGGLMAVLFAGGLLKSDTTRLREASIEVLATLKAAYSLATMSGRHHRVVFNLEEQTYHIEMCAGSPTLLKGDEEEEVDQDALAELREQQGRPDSGDMESEIVQADTPEAATAAAAALAGIRVGTSLCQPATSSLSGMPAKEGNKHKVDSDRGFKIKSIHVQHLSEPVDEGIASINFFPMGSAEKAVIELSAKGLEQTYSISLHGMTSRVEFHADEFDAEEHMRRNVLGDKEEER